MSDFREEDHKRDENGCFTDKDDKDMRPSAQILAELKEKYIIDLTEDEYDAIISLTPKEALGFSKERLRTKHHTNHMKSMGFKDPKKYQQAAIAFWKQEEGRLCYDMRRERYCKYSEKQNLFISVSQDGLIHTFFSLTQEQLKDYERQNNYLWLN